MLSNTPPTSSSRSVVCIARRFFSNVTLDDSRVMVEAAYAASRGIRCAGTLSFGASLPSSQRSLYGRRGSQIDLLLVPLAPAEEAADRPAEHVALASASSVAALDAVHEGFLAIRYPIDAALLENGHPAECSSELCSRRVRVALVGPVDVLDRGTLA